MSATPRLARALLGVLACLGCATKSLPPGTPPPEYEKRTFEPWPPPDAGAGVEATDAAPAPEAPAQDAGAPSDAAAPSETGIQTPL